MKNRFRRVLGSLLGSRPVDETPASSGGDTPAPDDGSVPPEDPGRALRGEAPSERDPEDEAAEGSASEVPVDSVREDRDGEEPAGAERQGSVVAEAPAPPQAPAASGPEPPHDADEPQAQTKKPQDDTTDSREPAPSTTTTSEEPGRGAVSGRKLSRKERARRKKQEATRRSGSGAAEPDADARAAARVGAEDATGVPEPLASGESTPSDTTLAGFSAAEGDAGPRQGQSPELPAPHPAPPAEDTPAEARAADDSPSLGAGDETAKASPPSAETPTGIEPAEFAAPSEAEPDRPVSPTSEPPAPVEPSEVHEDFDVPDRPRRNAEDMVRTFRDSPIMFFEQDAELRYVVVHNPPVLTEDLVVGKTDGDIFEPRDARRIVEIKRAVLEMGTSAREEIEVRLGGHGSSFELFVEPRRGQDGKVAGIVGILLEIGGRKRAEAAIIGDHDRLERRIVELDDELEIVRGALAEEETRRHRAEEAAQALQEQDSLTALPTRRVFNDRLAMSIVHSRRQRTKFAVVLLGLDGFRGINESLGRSVGDDLLRSVATVLEQCLRQGDTVSRLGGDEFVLLLPGFHRDDDVVRIAEKLRVSLRTPFTIGGRHVSVTGSLGIAVFPEDGADAESLLQNAAVALRRAKEKGGDAFDVHAPATSARATERLALESALRRALVGNSLTLHYQPIVEASTGKILSVEALLRFRNASGRLVPASEFLRELDATSLAVPLGLWSLRTACSQVRIWRDQGFGELSVAVNLTGRQLLHPSLVALVQRALGETGLPPDGLALEVGESDLVKSAEPALARLSELKKLGVRVAVDDFGTGEALLSRLHHFPVDGIKIDRSVIRGIESDESQKGVAAAAIALARARRLDVVAEGVETEGQRALLIRWRCDRLQGNLCGAPMPAQKMERELERSAKG